MINNITKQYFNKLPWLMPVAVDVLTPCDYQLYLYATNTPRIESDMEEPSAWYALVEADYLFMDEVVSHVEASFQVIVKGWCVLKDAQQNESSGLLPANTFAAHDNNNEGDRHNYKRVVYDNGMKYALLEVTPQSGVSINDFGLSYFSSIRA